MLHGSACRLEGGTELAPPSLQRRRHTWACMERNHAACLPVCQRVRCNAGFQRVSVKAASHGAACECRIADLQGALSTYPKRRARSGDPHGAVRA